MHLSNALAIVWCAIEQEQRASHIEEQQTRGHNPCPAKIVVKNTNNKETLTNQIRQKVNDK